VGLGINDQGKLKLDSGKLSEALKSNRADVEDFFATDETGLANRLSSLADRIAGESSGLLLNRSETLTTQIESNSNRIVSQNARLERERERLLLDFYSAELAISKIQSSQSAIDQIQQSLQV
jgi:flagellar hook-associated protein 2